jgi:hypothetical protein
MMYRGVPSSHPFTESSALADALSVLGLAANQLGPIDKAALPDLLARAFGADYANTPDPACSVLAETARELRWAHRALSRRGKCNVLVLEDVRATLRSAGARLHVVAELHRRMLVGMAIFAEGGRRVCIEKARGKHGKEGGAP